MMTIQHANEGQAPMPATRSLPWEALPAPVREYLLAQGIEPGSLVRFDKRQSVTDTRLLLTYRLRRDLNRASRRGAARMMARELGLHVDSVRRRLRSLRRLLGSDLVD
jgi:hypothetical protein